MGKSDDTRQRITTCAAKLFSEKGYDATGVAEICRAAKVSKGALYHHFPSKQRIFLELLHEWMEALDTGLRQAMEASGTVPQGLLSMAGEMKGVFSAADGRMGLFLEFWQQARRDPAVWKEFVAPYRRYTEYFAGIVRKGTDEGSLRRVDSDNAGHALVALAVGMLVQGLLDPKAAAWDKVTMAGVQLLVDGMKAK